MEGLFREWITGLTVIAVLGALVDILLPEGAFRKYTGFIFGLILLVLILQPLLRAMGSLGALEHALTAHLTQSELTAAAVQSARLSEITQQQLAAGLKEKLETRLEEHLGRFAKEGKVTAAVTFKQEHGQFQPGVIDRVDLAVTPARTEVQIECVVVRIDSSEAPRGEPVTTETPQFREIRSAAAALLQISEDQIRIYKTSS